MSCFISINAVRGQLEGLPKRFWTWHLHLMSPRNVAKFWSEKGMPIDLIQCVVTKLSGMGTLAGYLNRREQLS